jgi:uncharacterized protein
MHLSSAHRATLFASLIACSLAGIAQAGDPPAHAAPPPKAATADEPEQAAPPKEFDTYALVILRSGDAPQKPMDRKLLGQHLGHLKKMARLGKLVVAGPLDHQPDPSMRGLALYKTSLEEAKTLAEEDPAVKAGHLKVEVMTWHTEKGALAFPLAQSEAAPSQGK